MSRRSFGLIFSKFLATSSPRSLSIQVYATPFRVLLLIIKSSAQPYLAFAPVSPSSPSSFPRALVASWPVFSDLRGGTGFALFATSVLSTSFVMYVVSCKGTKLAKHLPVRLGESVQSLLGQHFHLDYGASHSSFRGVAKRLPIECS